MSALTLVKLSYFVAATLFLLGLQRMASPRTARSGIQWAGVGMLIATIATFFLPGLHNIGLMVAAIVIGVGLNWVWGKKVAITDMPQMVALFNGMGGGSAAAIWPFRCAWRPASSAKASNTPNVEGPNFNANQAVVPDSALASGSALARKSASAASWPGLASRRTNRASLVMMYSFG